MSAVTEDSGFKMLLPLEVGLDSDLGDFILPDVGLEFVLSDTS